MIKPNINPLSKMIPKQKGKGFWSFASSSDQRMRDTLAQKIRQAPNKRTEYNFWQNVFK